MPKPVYQIVTANAPGAVGLIQLYGEGASDVAASLTGRQPDAVCRLVQFAGIDEGLMVGLGQTWVQLMPHGGLRVIQLIGERLQELGCEPADELAARTIYPEADSVLEAEMLAMLARAASPAAIDLLLAQPTRWRQWIAAHTQQPPSPNDAMWQQIHSQSQTWNKLITPPTVVLVGQANVGKSTITNYMTGQATSITADLPGTTRDWVGGLAMLPTPAGQVCVRWCDTPGIRTSDDPIEQQAIAMARKMIAMADVIVAVRDGQTGWPDLTALPRTPEVWVANKADQPPSHNADATPVIHTVAITGQGLDDLATRITDVMGLRDFTSPWPWAFGPTLQQAVADRDWKALAGCCDAT